MTDKKKISPLFEIASSLDCSITDLEAVSACLNIYQDRLGNNLEFCKQSPAARMGTFVKWYKELDLLLMVTKEKLGVATKQIQELTDNLYTEARELKKEATSSDREAETGHPDAVEADS